MSLPPLSFVFSGLSDRAQSESIGVILLVGVVVITTTTVGVVAYEQVAADDRTNANVSVSVSEDAVALTHEGGEAIAHEDLRVVVANDSQRWDLDFSEGSTVVSASPDDPDAFEPGEVWANESFSFPPNETVQVAVYDTSTNDRLVKERVYPEENIPELP